MPSTRFDLFLSYNRQDELAVIELAELMKRNGLRPWLDQWELTPGQSRQEEIERIMGSVSTAVVTIGLGGQGPWQSREVQALLEEEVRRGLRVIPVLLPQAPSEPRLPVFLGRLTWVDLRHGVDARNVERLFAAILPSRPSPPPVHNLPLDSLGDLFLGRNTLLARLARELDGDPVNVPVPKQVLYGLGGIGKTRLAIEYAWRYGKRYSAAFFVSAESSQAVNRGLARLGSPRLMSLELDGVAAEDQIVERVLSWLHENPGWLLILDNVDSVDSAQSVMDLLPQLYGGHVLLTSRIARWPQDLHRHPVDRLDESVAARYLLERTDEDRQHSRDDTELATCLAGHLDGLPLALELAAAYVAVHGLGLADYLESWRRERPAVLAWHDVQETKYPMSVAVTWKKSFAQLGLTARALMRLMAHLAPAPIPLVMLTQGGKVVEKAAHLLAREDDEALKSSPIRTALAELVMHSFVTWQAQGAVVHRMVQAVVRSRIADEDRRAWIEMAVQLVSDFTPGDPSDIRNWQDWDRMRPHSRRVITLALRYDVCRPTTELMNNLGLLLFSRALFTEAEPFFRGALEINERISSDEPCGRAIATDLHNLARLLHEVNRLPEAEPLYRRALAIDKEIWGDQHPEVATDLFNLARLLHDLNRLEEAEPLYRRALGIDEGANPRMGVHIARDLNGLGRLFHDTNRRQEAESMFRRALRIDESICGCDHTFVARDLYNLARLLHATHHVEEAEHHYRRALEIDEAQLGAHHPHVATALNNLARLLHDTNRREEAGRLYQRALRIDEAALGSDHPRVARDLNNLGRFYRDTNRREEAEPLYRRALRINEESLGTKHPHVATVLNNLSRSLQDTKSWEDAESCCQRALQIDEAALGPDHPHVARDLYTLSRLLHETHRTEEAQTWCERALEIDEGAFGPDHPHVATILNHMARLLQETRLPEKAVELCRRALRINEAAFVSDHPRVARDRYRLACLLRDQNRREDAMPLARRALEIVERSLGESHPHTRTVQRFLAES